MDGDAVWSRVSVRWFVVFAAVDGRRTVYGYCRLTVDLCGQDNIRVAY